MSVIGRLKHRLGIILPSQDREGRRLPKARRAALRQVVLEWFARAFPGSTGDPVQIRPRLRGRWGSERGVTVEEVEEVWAYCDESTFGRHKRGLVALAERIAREGNQEAVAILVDSGLEIVVQEES